MREVGKSGRPKVRKTESPKVRKSGSPEEMHAEDTEVAEKNIF